MVFLHQRPDAFCDRDCGLVHDGAACAVAPDLAKMSEGYKHLLQNTGARHKVCDGAKNERLVEVCANYSKQAVLSQQKHTRRESVWGLKNVNLPNCGADGNFFSPLRVCS